MLTVINEWWNKFIQTREKIGWLCREVNIPIDRYRTTARRLIIWKKDLDPAICERKNWKRYLPNEVVKQKIYSWTAVIEWSNKVIDYTIWDISKNWIQINYIWNQLKLWDNLELTFLLWKNYTLKWKVVWNKNNLYWIEFEVPNNNDSFSALAKNYSKFVNMIISNTTH